MVQAFLPGDDVRVSALDLGGPLREALGFSRILRDPRSETRGEFLTMLDNASLSGSRDTQGGLSGFGQSQQVAFTPRLVDLRQEAGSGDERDSRSTTRIWRSEPDHQKWPRAGISAYSQTDALPTRRKTWPLRLADVN